MKKSILAMGLAFAVFTMSGMTSYAADGVTLSFTPEKTLEYRGLTPENGKVDLGDAFKGVAPGETRTQTITVKNENSRTADFYMSAEAVTALEEGTEKARGAGYEIELKIVSPEKSTVLYDSTLGGYAEDKDTSASDSGIKGMNSALKDNILIATLKQGESANVVLNITFDGEAMDNNTSAIDYSLTDGQLAFNFQVGYEDPTGTTVIVREVTEDGQVRYVKRVVEILENGVPLGAVATGDGAMIGIAVAVLAVGGILLVLGRKKKAEEEA